MIKSAADKNTIEDFALKLKEANKAQSEFLTLLFYKTLEILPLEIGLLTHLKRISICHTKITTLPTQIGLLANLKSFDFGSNALSFLPTEIGLLTNLEWLTVSHNKLANLPTQLGSLTNLRYLNLFANDLTTLPTQIGWLTKLTDLNIGINKLPSLPDELWQLTDLELFVANANKIESLSPGIGRMTKLVKVHLYSNLLTSLPSTIGQLEKLSELDLDNNNLVSLPPELGRLRELTKLSLEKNPGLRELPMNLADMPALLEIQITGSGISYAMRAIILSQSKQLRCKEVDNSLLLRLSKWMAYAESAVPFNIPLTLAQKLNLNEWLLRLEKTNDFSCTQTLLAKTVWNMLNDLHNREFSDFFFNQAEENNTHCQDRAAMSLNEVYTSWMLLCKSSGLPKREKFKLLAGVARTLRLRHTLQNLISKHENAIKRHNPGFIGEAESVEIFLRYETCLKEELQLVTAINRMAHGQIGYRLWIDRDELIKDVKMNFYEELIEIPIFAKMMEKEWEAIQAEFQSKLHRLGTCPKGGDFDPIVLNFKTRQGELMQAWKQKKIEVAKIAIS